MFEFRGRTRNATWISRKHLNTTRIGRRQVVDNLFANALDAVPADLGKVVVHLYPSVDWKHPEVPGYRVVIADNGYGISSEHQKRLFQPFFTTKAETGTGLGLWVARRIIREHRGAIRIRSSMRGIRSGTTFSFFLPCPHVKQSPQAALPAMAGCYAA